MAERAIAELGGNVTSWLHALTPTWPSSWPRTASGSTRSPRAVVATPLYERFVPKDKLDETLHSFYGFHPLGRVGTARDLANTITFLLPRPPAGSPARSGTSTAASWPDATNHPARPRAGPTTRRPGRTPTEKATDVAGARYGAAAEIRSPANLAPRSQMPGGRK